MSEILPFRYFFYSSFVGISLVFISSYVLDNEFYFVFTSVGNASTYINTLRHLNSLRNFQTFVNLLHCSYMHY